MTGLTYIRKLYGMSMQEVADGVGVSKQTVSKWESGKINNISEENLKKLSLLFEQNEEYFFKILSTSDEQKIQKQKLENEIEEMQIPEVDEEGNAYIREFIDTSELQYMDCLIKKQVVRDEVESLMKNVNIYSGMGQEVDRDNGEYGFDDLDCISSVINVLKSRSIETALLYTVLNVIENIDRKECKNRELRTSSYEKFSDNIAKSIRQYQEDLKNEGKNNWIY